jgi:hypothetical protein
MLYCRRLAFASLLCALIPLNQSFAAQASPGAQYHLVGEVQVQVVNTTPLIVSCRGLWAYTLSQDYEQFLAERIAGDSPQQAHKYLLHTGLLI